MNVFLFAVILAAMATQATSTFGTIRHCEVRDLANEANCTAPKTAPTRPCTKALDGDLVPASAWLSKNGFTPVYTLTFGQSYHLTHVGLTPHCQDSTRCAKYELTFDDASTQTFAMPCTNRTERCDDVYAEAFVLDPKPFSSTFSVQCIQLCPGATRSGFREINVFSETCIVENVTSSCDGGCVDASRPSVGTTCSATFTKDASQCDNAIDGKINTAWKSKKTGVAVYSLNFSTSYQLRRFDLTPPKAMAKQCLLYRLRWGDDYQHEQMINAECIKDPDLVPPTQMFTLNSHVDTTSFTFECMTICTSTDISHNVRQINIFGKDCNIL